MSDPLSSDPLAHVVSLLAPSAGWSKLVTGAGAWRVHRSEEGRPFYAAVLDGACRLALAGQEELVLEQGDFVLVPAACDFATSSLTPPPRDAPLLHAEVGPGMFWLGPREAQPNVRMLVGHCSFGSDDTALLVSLLPRVVHIRGEGRLTRIVELLNEETHARRPARDVILSHLLQVLLIEALRATTGPAAPPGLLRGLADERLCAALRCMHGDPTRAWSVKELAKEAGLSRSTFFDRFRAEVGVAPIEYLTGWRMALARDLLRQTGLGLARIAQQVGYGSASAFSVAFTRHFGLSPFLYAGRARGEGAPG
ncbi:AraC family transcriptional regulator [Novosphingobium rosa]|uniref:AraC family transcriptional regulator n=1 Tax=Novosphingobium rosa TaxID=76978 RepID=UPI00082A1163|nr:AraC family transcriptional regulator [Novosphingobium rosa]